MTPLEQLRKNVEELHATIDSLNENIRKLKKEGK
jgi:cell division protein FtsB